MPSQIGTTFGVYATAPTTNGSHVDIRLLEQRKTCQGLAVEVVERVGGRGHHRPGASIAERTLDGQVLGERRAAADPHGDSVMASAASLAEAFTPSTCVSVASLGEPTLLAACGRRYAFCVASAMPILAICARIVGRSARLDPRCSSRAFPTWFIAAVVALRRESDRYRGVADVEPWQDGLHHQGETARLVADPV